MFVYNIEYTLPHLLFTKTLLFAYSIIDVTQALGICFAIVVGKLLLTKRHHLFVLNILSGYKLFGGNLFFRHIMRLD